MHTEREAEGLRAMTTTATGTATVFCVHVSPQSADEPLAALFREAGLAVDRVHLSRLFFLEGRLSRREVERVARELLADRLVETAKVYGLGESPGADADATGHAFEVHLRPGVMDPVAQTTLAELRAEGFDVDSVRTARRVVVHGACDAADLHQAAYRVLVNDCIEVLIPGSQGVRPGPRPPVFEFRLRAVPMRGLDDGGLEKLARDGHLFLSTDEMRAIQRHFAALGRDPTDLELETFAQTWSEHCVHKTLKSEVEYTGAPFPDRPNDAPIQRRYANLLKDTIVRATQELMAEKRGPQCLSVFKDNAGVIAFDGEWGIAFKVETHNHPSAIEPYGGAATGVGGCIRDVLGCGLAAKPIANTDVFCVAPPDWPETALPRGVLHPRRILRGVVRGVADYGNRMGIPTVNGAVQFDPRYLGNPLVFCGCVGLIPRNRLDKAPLRNDAIVLIGGRTGRDGIHGATFSSAELTDTHAGEFSHAVQIGNAITEKRCVDAVLRARHGGPNGECLFSSITDCGAGGLSSAVGEMAESLGAIVDLERVPLKYAGMRYDEIWISEAQERMVLAVPQANLPAFFRIMQEEEVEATCIGVFGHGSANDPHLLVRYEGQVVGNLSLKFLHGGLPRPLRTAEWHPPVRRDLPPKAAGGWRVGLLRRLKHPSIASKNWVIRKYDHEVQGGSVVKPLAGPGNGPADAAVLRPVLSQHAGIAVGCGLAPHLGDMDPYWMAIASIDEALRNIVCVGGDPARTALLDNFCWGRCDDPMQMGALVRACQACYDAAKAFGAPFISGKDSLNNEFLLDPADLDALIAACRDFQGTGEGLFAPLDDRALRQTGRLRIPPTLLISALALVSDVRRCVTSDFKRPGNTLVLVEGRSLEEGDLKALAGIHAAVARAIASGAVGACHDASEAGWLTAAAEMAIGGQRGVELELPADGPDPFEHRNGCYLIELAAGGVERPAFAGVTTLRVGRVVDAPVFSVGAERIDLRALEQAWRTEPGRLTVG